MKLIRIRKVSVVITNLQQPMQIKSQLKRLYVIFMLVIICHIQGCIIYIIVLPSETWIPPTDFGIISTDTFEVENRSFMHQYLKMVYHSTLVYSMVDISGRTHSELLCFSALVIISAIINAIIYGQFANLTEELKMNSNEFLNKLNLVNSVMASEALPMAIKTEVREYILTTHNLKRLQDEQMEFNGNISPSLQALVRTKIFSKAYHNSRLARFMKISLYKEWLDIKNINRTL